MKLKSRTQSPPNGFLWEQKETSWKNWIAAPHTVWDFAALARELQAHRRANKKRFPWLAIDFPTIEKQLDEANALRVSKMANTESYLVQDAAPPKTVAPPISERVVAAVAGLTKAVKGAVVLLDWEKSGDPPVSQERADQRATVCSTCPKNGTGDLSRYFTVPASELIRRQMERSRDLKLESPMNSKLGICEACLCPLRLKIWAPIVHIVNRMPAEIKAELDPRCWVLGEAKQA